MNFAQVATDTEIILHSLQNERDHLHNRLMQIDRIMTRIRKIEYQPIEPIEALEMPVITNDIRDEFPKTADIKIQVLRVFDIIGKACQLSEVQHEYSNITGSSYKIREAVRALNATGILKMLKYRNASRGFMWVKKDWIENGELLNKFKPLGFDLLYSKENLLYI